MLVVGFITVASVGIGYVRVPVYYYLTTVSIYKTLYRFISLSFSDERDESILAPLLVVMKKRNTYVNVTLLMLPCK